MQLPNLSALKIDQTRRKRQPAPTSTLNLPAIDVDGKEAGLVQAMHQVRQYYVDQDVHGERLGWSLNLEPEDQKYSQHPELLQYLLRLNPNNIYFLRDALLQGNTESAMLLDMALRGYASPEAYLLHFSHIRDHPNGTAAKLFTDVMIKGGRLKLLLEALDWNLDYTDRLYDSKIKDELAGHSLQDTGSGLKNKFPGRVRQAKGIWEETSMEIRTRIYDQTFPFDVEGPSVLREGRDPRRVFGEFPGVLIDNLQAPVADKVLSVSRHRMVNSYYRTHMTNAILQIIKAIPAAMEAIGWDKPMDEKPLIGKYLIYVCAYTVKMEVQIARGRFPGNYRDFFGEQAFSWMKGHREFLSQFCHFTADPELQAFRIANGENFYVRFFNRKVVENDRIFKPVLENFGTNILWRIHGPYISGREDLLEIAASRLLQWPYEFKVRMGHQGRIIIPKRQEPPLGRLPMFSTLIQPNLEWARSQQAEVAHRFLEQLSIDEIEDLDRKFSDPSDYGGFTHDEALQIHKTWKRVNLAIALAGRIHFLKANPQNHGEQPIANHPDEGADLDRAEQLETRCMQHAVYQYYNALMATIMTQSHESYELTIEDQEDDANEAHAEVEERAMRMHTGEDRGESSSAQRKEAPGNAFRMADRNIRLQNLEKDEEDAAKRNSGKRARGDGEWAIKRVASEQYQIDPIVRLLMQPNTTVGKSNVDWGA